MHKGVDFAGKENAPIIATASGIVSWSGERYGYGNLIEIDHGDGYKTRYGHNKTLLVDHGRCGRKRADYCSYGKHRTLNWAACSLRDIAQ